MARLKSRNWPTSSGSRRLRIGQPIEVVHATQEQDFEPAFATLLRAGARALLVATDVFLLSRREQLIQLAARNALPAMYGFRENALSGGPTKVFAAKNERDLELAFEISIRRGAGAMVIVSDTFFLSRMACATAHYWARELSALGHEVRLMPAQYGSKATNADPWVIGLRRRRPSLVVAVALANKTARIAWAVMHRQENYQRMAIAA